MSDERDYGPEFEEYANHFRRDAVEKMANSAFVMTLVTSDEFDVKLAMETGAAILLNKPIVVVRTPGATEDDFPGLTRIAHAVIDADIDTEEGRRQFDLALKRVMADLAIGDDS
jgi:hypothetical protein